MTAMNDVIRTYRPRKAVVLTAQQPDYFRDTVLPRFQQRNVEVVKVVDPNGGAVFTIPEAPYVIICLEFLDKALVKKCIQKAKEAGKKVVSLHRQVGEWQRAFDELDAQERDDVPSPTPPKRPIMLAGPPIELPPPVPSATPVLVTAHDDYKSFLQMYEEENTVLQARVREAEAKADTHQTRLVIVSREAGETASKLSKVEGDLKAAHAEIARLCQAVADAQNVQPPPVEQSATYKSLLATANNLRQDVELAGRRNIDARTKIQALEKQLKEKQEMFGTAEQRLERMERRLQESKAQHDQEMEQVQSDLLEAQTALATVKRELEVKSGFINSARAEANKVHDLDKDLKQLKHVNKNLENEIERLKQGRPLTPPTAGPISTSAVRDVENFLKVRDAFKVVWKAGGMDGLEILQKLMEWEPKKG